MAILASNLISPMEVRSLGRFDSLCFCAAIYCADLEEPNLTDFMLVGFPAHSKRGVCSPHTLILPPGEVVPAPGLLPFS